MNYKKNNIITLMFLIISYFLLKYTIPYGIYTLYPVNLLVTFLHELGHCLGAILTGGNVSGIEINSNGSGLATTSGGFRPIVIMGGYIGSGILGNLLLYIGLKKEKHSKITIYILAGIMAFTSIVWFSGMISSIILLLMSGIFIFIAKKTKFDKIILQFLGVASILFILEDFNVGPSSDLANFSNIFIIIPQFIWMIIWLIIVICITIFNLKLIFKK